MSEYHPKERLPRARTGLNRKPHPIENLDGRTKPVRVYKKFAAGIQEDLGGEVSFGQEALIELAFWKFFVLSEFVGILLRSGKKNAMLTIMTNEKINRTFNCTANSFRGDLRDIFGPKGIRKVEKRMKSLNEQLLELAQGQQSQEEKGQGEDKEADQAS
ncbi:MAG: hypothetical protein ABSB32_10245 [Thermodesulfobacteriota bacterium]|jgi:hypothetical protein